MTEVTSEKSEEVDSLIFLTSFRYSYIGIGRELSIRYSVMEYRWWKCYFVCESILLIYGVVPILRVSPYSLILLKLIYSLERESFPGVISSFWSIGEKIFRGDVSKVRFLAYLSEILRLLSFGQVIFNCKYGNTGTIFSW